MARAKEWRQTVWGLFLPPSTTAYMQSDQPIFTVDPGWTLIRTRVDISIYTYVVELSGVTPTYDPGLFQEVQMRFGISWIDASGGGTPPMLNDSGGSGIDWVIWDTMVPRIEVPSASTGDGSMGVSWITNGGGTLNSESRRGPVVSSEGQVWASLGYDDPGEFLAHLVATFDAATKVTIGIKCLFETAPA